MSKLVYDNLTGINKILYFRFFFFKFLRQKTKSIKPRYISLISRLKQHKKQKFKVLLK